VSRLDKALATILVLFGAGVAALPSVASTSPAAPPRETCQLVTTRPPVIHGRPEVGHTLHATHGVWRCQR
jgi:hypothetical protein